MPAFWHSIQKSGWFYLVFPFALQPRLVSVSESPFLGFSNAWVQECAMMPGFLLPFGGFILAHLTLKSFILLSWIWHMWDSGLILFSCIWDILLSIHPKKVLCCFLLSWVITGISNWAIQHFGYYRHINNIDYSSHWTLAIFSFYL